MGVSGRVILEKKLGQKKFPEDTLFNVNLPAVPPGEVQGIRVTTLGRRRYSMRLLEQKTPLVENTFGWGRSSQLEGCGGF
ncbi:MAG: hypothetical protein Ct9H300mP15_28250 [Gemmatimonadota bacterium]|nr:MAG: hypothetical protein Ct9H300mP15_28250 [Gemmatimonadota bacterium]